VQFKHLQNPIGLYGKIIHFKSIFSKCLQHIYSLKTFDIAGPFEGTTATPAATAVGDSIGDCLTDQFSVSSPGNRGSPIICGFNTGQHSEDDGVILMK